MVGAGNQGPKCQRGRSRHRRDLPVRRRNLAAADRPRRAAQRELDDHQLPEGPGNGRAHVHGEERRRGPNVGQGGPHRAVLYLPRRRARLVHRRRHPAAARAARGAPDRPGPLFREGDRGDRSGAAQHPVAARVIGTGVRRRRRPEDAVPHRGGPQRGDLQRRSRPDLAVGRQLAGVFGRGLYRRAVGRDRYADRAATTPRARLSAFTKSAWTGR